MKKQFFIATLATLALLASTTVYAVTAAPPVTAPAPIAPSTPAPAPVAAAVTAPASDASQFTEHKQKLLESINDHIAKMQKRQSCIQVATDEKALEACRLSEGEPKPALAPVTKP